MLSVRLVSIVGARPQFIKAVMVSRALARHTHVTEILVHTGQHYDTNMSDLFFKELSLPVPKFNLHIGSGSHGQQTGRMLEQIEAVLLETRPEMVLTYGDTNSTLAGTLAAAKLRVPVSHIEAGLRSCNRHMPEEINRIVADHCSDLLFAPTATAVQNLQLEGIPQERILCSGDVMYDAVLHFAVKAEASSRLLKGLKLQSGEYILVTLHRCENADDPHRLHAIMEGLAEVARQIRVVMPLHPRTQKAVERAGISKSVLDRLDLLEPVGYLDMMLLQKNARLIVTDSGGMQKEAYFHRVPCVTLRGETEWLETLEGGCNEIVFPENHEIVAARTTHALERRPVFGNHIFGDGHSAEYIADTVACWNRRFDVMRDKALSQVD